MSCSRVIANSFRSLRVASSPITHRAAAFSTSASRFADAPSTPVSPKIGTIVDQISTLSLLEVSELVGELKTRLNITEVAMPSAGAAAPAAAAASADAPAEEKPKEKTIFSLKLEKIDPAQKAKVIKEVKALIPNMNLVEAKKFVESVPKTVKENMPKDDAEKLKKTLEALGATVTLE